MAVKVEEIRVGNTFLGYDNQPFNWSLHEFLLLGETDIDEIIKEPIPLTEEWLLKFAFEFKSMGSGGAVCSRHSGHWYKDGWPIFFGSKGKNFDCFFLTHKELEIPFVHELQNLYYTLTGQELTA